MGRRRKKRKEDVAEAGWIATYADTVTLLLTFFILLYSMSSVDAKKMEQLSEAFQTMMSGKKGDTMLEYNLYNGQVPLIGGESPISEPIDEAESTEEQMYYEVKKFVEEHDLSEVTDIINSERGIVIQLRDNVLFEPAQAVVRDESKGVLDTISELLAELPNRILVEGHTDTRPINTEKFPSNWELSVDRAVNVVRYFIEQKGLEASRFTASGYGEYQPIAPNDTAENMALNRRVNILILSEDGEEE